MYTHTTHPPTHPHTHIHTHQTGTATVDSGIPDGWMGLDVGPQSIATFSGIISGAATIIWNGPVGVFEFEKFATGSKTVLETIVHATEKGATSIIGELLTTAGLCKL